MGSNPPVPSSPPGNKPVPFTPEFCRGVEQLLVERHGLHISADERFTVHGEIAHGHASVICEFSNVARTFLLKLEMAVECGPNDINNPFDARDAALDHANLVFANFFESERFLHFREIWQEYDMDGVAVLMRGALTHPLLEEEADHFLAEHGFDQDGHEQQGPPPPARPKD